MLEIHTVVPFKVLRAASPYLARRGQGRPGGRPRGLPQGRQRHLDLGHAGQLRAGELLGGEGRPRRADEDARPRVGRVQGQRQRGRVRLRRDAPDTADLPQQMRDAAPQIIPLGRPAPAGGGRGRDLLPLLAVVELRPRPGDHGERRPDDGDDMTRASTSRRSGVAGAERTLRGHGGGAPPYADGDGRRPGRSGLRDRACVGGDRARVARRGLRRGAQAGRALRAGHGPPPADRGRA